jgi:hypothetical protein
LLSERACRQSAEFAGQPFYMNQGVEPEDKVPAARRAAARSTRWRTYPIRCRIRSIHRSMDGSTGTDSARVYQYVA